MDGINFHPPMNELMQNLLKLQALEFNESVEPDMEKCIAELRIKIPTPILGHYERLVARGKKGAAVIHHQVCTGCHVQVPRGVVLTLTHNEDIQICENCGRYLYLPEPAETAKPVAVSKKSKARKKSEAPLSVT
jgi:predicted  nucleic acid-binding Zn-ribbon protein